MSEQEARSFTAAMLETTNGGPAVLRILLGVRLRRIREAGNVTREAAAQAIRASESTISRLELGRVGLAERDVAQLLTSYGLADEQDRAALLSLARRANEPGWWQDYSNVLPHWFEIYLGLEQAATRIRTYEVQFVPGLLQTEDYARAVTLLGHPHVAEEDIERRVALRMARQELLRRDDAPHLWAVVDEAALRRPIGGTGTMRRQLDRLIEAVDAMPGVVVQVVPFSKGGHAAAGGPFTILRFADPALPDVVYMEQLTTALYLAEPEDTGPYLVVMERLCLEAEPADATVEVLRRIKAAL